MVRDALKEQEGQGAGPSPDQVAHEQQHGVLALLAKLKTGECSVKELRSDMPLFELYVKNFLSIVVGKNMFNKRKGMDLLSQYTTVSDEAYGVLALENSIELWTQEVVNKLREDGGKAAADHQNTTLPKKKYTSNAAAARKFGGWDRNGIARYNLLYNQVREERKTEEVGTCVEQWLLQRIQQEEMDKNANKKRKNNDAIYVDALKPITIESYAPPNKLPAYDNTLPPYDNNSCGGPYDNHVATGSGSSTSLTSVSARDAHVQNDATNQREI
jgi:hypothetical protein